MIIKDVDGDFDPLLGYRVARSGSVGGSIGGKRRLIKMTPEQRSAVARLGAVAANKIKPQKDTLSKRK